MPLSFGQPLVVDFGGFSEQRQHHQRLPPESPLQRNPGHLEPLRHGRELAVARRGGRNDRESAAIGAMQVLNDEPLNTEKQMTLDPASVQEWVSGVFPNHGLLLKTEAELDDRFDFKTSDNANASQRPKLVIQYTSASTTPTPTPAPGFIFGDDFESGNLSKWSWAETEGGKLAVSTQAAWQGSYGLQVTLDGADAPKPTTTARMAKPISARAST